MEKTQDPRAMERHAQTIMTLIVVALLVWVGTTTQEASVKIATLEVQVTALNKRLDRPDAVQELLIEQNKELRSRILKLEENDRNGS
jgi:cell division protein FtsB